MTEEFKLFLKMQKNWGYGSREEVRVDVNEE